jgi:hypothetical protein
MAIQLFQGFFVVFQTHVSSVSSVFRRMLQMFHLDISKVNWVLYLPPCLGVSSSRRQLDIRCPIPLFSMLVAFGVHIRVLVSLFSIRSQVKVTSTYIAATTEM